MKPFIAGIVCLWASCMGGGQLAHAQEAAPVPVYATEFRPPEEYRVWYREAERCAGFRGNYHKVIFAVTEKPWKTGYDSLSKTALYTYGQWTSAEHGYGLIVLNADDWRNEFYVKHEMLHDILWRNGWKNPSTPTNLADTVDIRSRHPVPPYERCAPTYIEDARKMDVEQRSVVKQVYRP